MLSFSHICYEHSHPLGLQFTKVIICSIPKASRLHCTQTGHGADQEMSMPEKLTFAHDEKGHNEMRKRSPRTQTYGTYVSPEENHASDCHEHLIKRTGEAKDGRSRSRNVPDGGERGHKRPASSLPFIQSLFHEPLRLPS